MEIPQALQLVKTRFKLIAMLSRIMQIAKDLAKWSRELAKWHATCPLADSRTSQAILSSNSFRMNSSAGDGGSKGTTSSICLISGRRLIRLLSGISSGQATSASPLIYASSLDVAAHRLTTSNAPGRVVDAEIRPQLREWRSGSSGFTWLPRRPASTRSVQELRFLLDDIFLGGVGLWRIRRLYGSLLLTIRWCLHRG